jgi:hypothetical protein
MLDRGVVSHTGYCVCCRYCFINGTKLCVVMVEDL